MGIKSWLQQAARTLKLAVKPGREELWLSIKISLLGIGAVGLIGFVIKLIATTLNPGVGTAATT
ncbi:MAG: protein translocase SEC61 complex subunit gamma [Chloroflexi bacterium]|nr:protein translocase SEC61 complex subunit gamma [Chloroflexota bacterium]